MSNGEVGIKSEYTQYCEEELASIKEILEKNEYELKGKALLFLCGYMSGRVGQLRDSHDTQLVYYKNEIARLNAILGL